MLRVNNASRVLVYVSLLVGEFCDLFPFSAMYDVLYTLLEIWSSQRVLGDSPSFGVRVL